MAVAECGLLQAWLDVMAYDRSQCVHDPGGGSGKNDFIAMHELVASDSSDAESDLDTRKDHAAGNVTERRHSASKLIFACMLLNNLIVAVGVSLMMPFFANVAYGKDANSRSVASHTAVGFIFSVATLLEVLVAPLAAKELSKAGSKLMATLSALTISVSVLLFAFVDKIETWPSFLGLCLAIRLVQGFATAVNKVAAYSIIVGAMPESTGITNGALQASIVGGYALGPVLGGFLYDSNGFALPFYVGAGLQLVNALILLFVLPSNERKLSSSAMEASAGFSKVLCLPWVCFVLLSCFLANAIMGYIEPTFPRFIKLHFHLQSKYSGLGLFIWAAIYSVASPIIGYFLDRCLSPRLALVVGFGVSAVGCQLIGPAPFLALPDSLALTYFAFVLLAIGTALILTAAAPDLFQTLEDSGYSDPVAVRAVVGGLFQAALSLGYGTGPIAGSTLAAVVGFQKACSLLGTVYFGWMVIILAGGILMWRHKRLVKTKVIDAAV